MAKKNFDGTLEEEAAAFSAALTFISESEPPAVRGDRTQQEPPEPIIKPRAKRSERLQALLTKDNLDYLNRKSKELGVSRNELLNCLLENIRAKEN